VIGVIQDVRENGVQTNAPEIVYWPALTDNRFVPGVRTVTFVIRSNVQAPKAFLPRCVSSVSVNSTSASRLRTMQRWYEQILAQTSFTLVCWPSPGHGDGIRDYRIYGVHFVHRSPSRAGNRHSCGAGHKAGDVLQMVLSPGAKNSSWQAVAIGMVAALG